MKGSLGIVLVCLISSVALVQCSGCEKGDDNKVKSVEVQKNSDQSEKLDFSNDSSRKEWKEINTSLNTFFEAQNTQDWDTHLDYMIPKVFEVTGRDKIHESLSYWEDRGLRNYTENIQLERVSPLVEDDTSEYAVVWFSGQLIVDYDSTYQGNPAGHFKQYALRYGEEFMTYDSLERKFIIDAPFKIYAQSMKGEEKWYFVNDGFQRSPETKNTIDYDIFYELRQLEK
jgi:hypothetical protein